MEAEYAVRPNVVSTELDDSEAVVLDLTTRKYYTLNESGTAIWSAMREGISVEEIAAELVQSFQVDHEGAVEHVRSFLRDLASDGLVELAGQSPSE